jgi:Coenzyme PQQ synthesis protein D (PqqD)
MLASLSEDVVHLSETAEIVVSRDQVSSDLGDEAAILNFKNGVYYGLDSVATRVWKLIHEPKTFGKLRDMLAAEFDVDEQRLESDLRILLSELARQELVEISQ